MRFLTASMVMALPFSSGAQSLLDRSPNLSGDWVGAPGTVYFHFVHRFTVSEAPERKVSNTPTFLLAAGLPKRLLAGFNYATNSSLTNDFPNEWELFARWAPVSEDLGAAVDIGAQVGYNNSTSGVDAELSAAKRIGRIRLIGAGRALSDPFDSGHRQWAVAGGGTFRLSQFLALAGDVATLTSRDSSESVAWSAGVNIAIPFSPHTLSLNATNAPIATLQGQSRGTNKVRYGFEFTIPLTLRRYFGKRAETSSTPDTVASTVVAQVDSAAPGHTAVEATVQAPLPPTAAVKVSPAVAPVTTPSVRDTATRVAAAPAIPKRAAAVKRAVIKNLNFMQSRIEVTAGTTVEWINNDPLPHSVTATDGTFNSGLIQPGKSYRHTFNKAGTYRYHCMPHPFMQGVVVVREP